MKTRILLFCVLLFLSSCMDEHERFTKNDKNFRVLCINGLSFLSYQGTMSKNFIQIYQPADDPANPPQPKTCPKKTKTSELFPRS